MICVEKYVHFVASGCDNWRREVQGRRWSVRVATTLVQQVGSITICYFDEITRAGVHVAGINCKMCKFQPQYHPSCHFNRLCQVNVVVVVIGEVWRAHDTCGNVIVTIVEMICFS